MKIKYQLKPSNWVNQINFEWTIHMLHDADILKVKYFLTALLKESILVLPLMSFGSEFHCFGAENE